MTKLTIKQNDALRKLARKSGKSVDELSDQIIERAIQADVIKDHWDYAGFLLIYHFEQNGFPVELATLFCLGRYTKKLGDLFQKLTVWGGDDDCPECGAPLEYDMSDTHYRQVTENSSPYREGDVYIRCENATCDYKLTDKAENLWIH